LDTLHTVLRTIRTETKSVKDHLNVFREFLAYLDQLQGTGEAAAWQGADASEASEARNGGLALLSFPPPSAGKLRAVGREITSARA
jgi:hypothetical protein